MFPQLNLEDIKTLLSFTLPGPSCSGFIWNLHHIVMYLYREHKASATGIQCTSIQFENQYLEQMKNLTKRRDYICDDDGNDFYLTSFGVLKILEMMKDDNSMVYLMFRRVQEYLDTVVAERMAPHTLTRHLTRQANNEVYEITKRVVLMEYLYVLAYDLYQESSVQHFGPLIK